MSQPARQSPNTTSDAAPQMKLVGASRASDRRRFRRHDLMQPQLVVEQVDETGGVSRPVGELVDLSAGGVRVRTLDATIRPGQTLSIRLRLPSHAGITPFVSSSGGELRPACEWAGALAVLRRVEQLDGTIDLGGQLLGMDEAVRGMLSLYLSIQPLAA